MHFSVRCIKCIPPAEQWGRREDLSESLPGGTNWPAVLVYVLCLSLCFLSPHARPDLPVVDVWIRCHFIWYLPSPAVDGWNPNLLLTWGSAMGSLSVCSLPLLFLPPPPPTLPFSFLATFQASKRSYVRLSGRWRKTLWGSCPTKETPLTKRRREHSAVRKTVICDASRSYRHLPGLHLTHAQLLKSASSSRMPSLKFCKKKNPFCIVAVLMKMPVLPHLIDFISNDTLFHW